MSTTTAAVIFVVIAVVLCALEVFATSLVFLPFGLGAAVAAIAGFLGLPPVGQAIVFLLASLGFYLALQPLSRRWNKMGPIDGIGAQRLIGATGVVLENIDAGDTGLVRIDREEWRAEAEGDHTLVVGMPIAVIDVVGTRVIVRPDHSDQLGNPA